MTEIINAIPNIEPGRHQTITLCDSESAVSVAAALIHRLCGEYNTSVCLISLTDRADAINECCEGMKTVGTLNVLKQRNRNCRTIIDHAAAQYNRRFVRAFIIDGTDRITVPGKDGKPETNADAVEHHLSSFARGFNVPVISLVTSS